VTHSHPPSDTQSPPLVTHSHPPSDTQSPEYSTEVSTVNIPANAQGARARVANTVPSEDAVNELDGSCEHYRGGPDAQASFQAFLDRYPHGQGSPRRAREIWYGRGLHNRREEIMDGLEKWRASEEWKQENGRYIPRFDRFLDDELWLSEPKSKSQQRLSKYPF